MENKEYENYADRIDENTGYPGSFYVLSQYDQNYNSETSIIRGRITYEEYFNFRLNHVHNTTIPSSYQQQANQIVKYCDSESVEDLALFIKAHVKYPNDDECVIDGLLTFVQDRGEFEASLHYISDKDEDFCKYPIETLCEGGGDCEDLSILFASMLKALGYEAAILIIPGHAFVGVAMEENPTYSSGVYYEISDKKFYPCETTAYGYLAGDLPSGIEEENAYYALV